MKKLQPFTLYVVGYLAASCLMFFAGRESNEMKVNEIKLNCCSTTSLCQNSVNAINALQDYQLQFHNDTLQFFDGDRLVGVNVSPSFNHGAFIDSLILADNL